MKSFPEDIRTVEWPEIKDVEAEFCSSRDGHVIVEDGMDVKAVATAGIDTCIGVLLYSEEAEVASLNHFIVTDVWDFGQESYTTNESLGEMMGDFVDRRPGASAEARIVVGDFPDMGLLEMTQRGLYRGPLDLERLEIDYPGPGRPMKFTGEKVDDISDVYTAGVYFDCSSGRIGEYSKDAGAEI